MMPVSEYSKDTDRTTDVQTQDQTTFHTFVENHPLVLKGLTNCGYINASPIQVAACPVIIAGNGKYTPTILLLSMFIICDFCRHYSRS